jgi:hypothetical protein
MMPPTLLIPMPMMLVLMLLMLPMLPMLMLKVMMLMLMMMMMMMMLMLMMMMMLMMMRWAELGCPSILPPPRPASSRRPETAAERGAYRLLLPLLRSRAPPKETNAVNPAPRRSNNESEPDSSHHPMN